LGLQFGISESYAHKIYHKMSTLLVKILHVKNRQTQGNRTTISLW
jgi:hypothetical protein